jgi:hypothetical protein
MLALAITSRNTIVRVPASTWHYDIFHHKQQTLIALRIRVLAVVIVIVIVPTTRDGCLFDGCCSRVRTILACLSQYYWIRVYDANESSREKQKFTAFADAFCTQIEEIIFEMFRIQAKKIDNRVNNAYHLAAHCGETR